MLVGLQIWHLLTSVSNSSHRKVYSSSSQGLHKQDDQVLQKKPFLQVFHNKNLCPVDTLVLYEEKTKCLRTAISNELYPLLISFWKPHKPDTSASISRWIKELLAKAGRHQHRNFIHHDQERHLHQPQGCKGCQQQTSWSCLDGHENQPLKDSTMRATTSQRLSCPQGKSLNHTLSYMKPCHNVEL